MADPHQYVAAAKSKLLEILESELAIVKPEAIARLSEAYFAGHAGNIDAHHVGAALEELEQDGRILVDAPRPSKGGHRVSTIQPANQYGRTTAVTRAAKRKRALYARYSSWAQGTARDPHGFIGPAGEAATRAAILDSAAIQPAAPGAGPVSRILGIALPGALDSAGYMTTVISGVPQPPVTMLFEVKNVRGWIYPNSSEVFQVLHKGIVLQQAHPDVPIVPVLVCRAAHKTSFWMASQLGFVVIPMGIQYVGNKVSEESLREVRNGLSFNDLHHGEGPSLRVRDRLRTHLPPHVHSISARWQSTALDPDMSSRLSQLRRPIDRHDRQQVLNEIRTLNRENGARGGW